LLKVTNKLDRHLFFCSTYITIGNGKSTPLWKARWLQGAAPKDVAPNLYSLAKFKTRSVCTELSSNNWIRNLGEITTATQLEEFTMLFMAIDSIQLSQEKDNIS
jgi:hypothetical protein